MKIWLLSSISKTKISITNKYFLCNTFFSFGMVPNGGRVYYSRRSQPPLLTQMVAVFYNATGNDSFVEEMLPFLDQEYEFWQENRSLFLESLGYEANHYATFTNQPRLVQIIIIIILCYLDPQ